MANTVFKLRRSSVAGKIPTTSDIAIGELGLNLTDRIVYSSDGTNVWEIGANNRNAQVSNTFYVGNSSVNTFINSTSVSVKTATVNSLVVTSITANGSTGAGKYLTSNGTAVYWDQLAGVAEVRQQYTANGTGTVYTVTGGYRPNYLSVYLNGVLLRNGVDVDVSGGLDFSFTEAPANGVLIDVVGISTYYSNGTATVVSQQFTANGTANSFTISGGYVANNIQVFLNGVKQINGTDVNTNSGNTVDFIVTPSNGYIVDVFGYQQDVLIVGGSYSYGNGTTNTYLTAGQIVVSDPDGTANITPNEIFLGNSSVNCVINSTSIYVNGVDYNPTTALAIAVALS